MKDNKGITLIAVILTVIILSLLAGVIVFNVNKTYENSSIMQFTSYMKMIQKKVDFYVEEETNYETLGKTLSSSDKTRLQDIINKDTKNLISTNDVNSTELRYFNSDDIYKYFEISNINDEIVVNFENREVISLNGVEKDGNKYYVENGV